jgi:ribosomal protein L40E
VKNGETDSRKVEVKFKFKKMFCPNCGAEVSEKAVVCIKCGVGLNNAAQRNVAGLPQPKTWLTESILATLFCCLPFGIAGIVNAANVSSRFSAGDIEGAQRASQQAGKWTKTSFWLGLIGILIYIIMMALGGFAALMRM